MKIDSTTWCSENNLAGKYLADELNYIGDDNLLGIVSTYFHRFNIRMKALNSLEKGMRHFYLLLLLEKTEKEINKNIKYNKIASLMLNIITAIYRNELLKINQK
jgi:hypothetical protein